MPHIRAFLTAAAAVAIVAVALSGCVAAPDQKPQPAYTQQATHSTASVKDLYGKHALFLSRFSSQHPGLIDSSLLPGTFFFEKAGVGSQEFDLPSLPAGDDQLVLMIFCDEKSNYDLSLVSGGKRIDRTWGGSCASDRGIVTYKTAPLKDPGATFVLNVKTLEKVPFRISILALSAT